MFSRMCVCITVLVYAIAVAKPEEESSALTSTIFRKNKTNYLSFAGKTYYFGTVFKANFHRAIQYCNQQSMQLVSISSQPENERLGRFAEEIGNQYGHFWTSGTNLADESQWIWLSTGGNLIYTNWHPGEPSLKSSSNETESCVEARHFGKGFTWNDLRCSAECYFICEGRDCR